MKAPKKPKSIEFNQKCPDCGSENLIWDREGSTDIITVTCSDCDKTVTVLEERKYFLTDRSKL